MKNQNGADDYSAMRETLKRRIEHLKDERGSYSNVPDLILLDGGMTHVGVVKTLFSEMGINIPIFGMIKDEHHKTRTLTDGENEISLITRQDAFVFIYKIQEEVHRYSLSLMDAKRRNAVKKSSLTEIKGVGAKRANDLMLHFGTLAALKSATEEELLKVKGINPETARAICDYFGKEEENEKR